MENKRIKKFNRLVIKLFMAIGITSSCIAIIAELSGYIFVPYGEGKNYPLYRHYNVLTKTIETLNAVGYWSLKKFNDLFGIQTYSFRCNWSNGIVFLVAQILFYFLVGWITASLLFPVRPDLNTNVESET